MASISGMNMGANVGINIIYSGTVAAAVESAFLGVPAIAVSLHLGSQATLLRPVADEVIVHPVGHGPDHREPQEPQPPVGERVVIFLDAVALVGMAEHPIRVLAHLSTPSSKGSRAASSNFCLFLGV